MGFGVWFVYWTGSSCIALAGLELLLFMPRQRLSFQDSLEFTVLLGILAHPDSQTCLCRGFLIDNLFFLLVKTPCRYSALFLIYYCMDACVCLAIACSCQRTACGIWFSPEKQTLVLRLEANIFAH